MQTQFERTEVARHGRTTGWRWLAALLPAVAACGLLTTAGCREEPQEEEVAVVESDTGREWSEHHFENAVSNLQRLEEFAGNQMRQQIIDRFNQWVQHEELPPDWKVDPLAAGLPEPMKQLPIMQSLDRLLFLPFDGHALQEAVWLHALSNWARGEQIEDMTRAQNLFDWTIRNIQLTPGTGMEPDRFPQQPWETLLLGRGTAIDRAWVFILLLRQQGIDAVMLGVPDPADPSGKKIAPWAVGVLHEGKLYLFDPAIGLPIPGPRGARFEKDRLVFAPATLSDVVKDPGLLRKLDLKGHTYPVTADQLKGVVAMVEASPAYLEARMRLVETRLTGDQQLTLTTDPSALMGILKKVPNLADRRLWPWPYEVLLKRSVLTPEQKKLQKRMMHPYRVGRGTPLWKGRVLHLKGEFDGTHKAKYYYQKARPSKRKIALQKRQMADESSPEVAKRMRGILEAEERGKCDATYWLAMIAVSSPNPEERRPKAKIAMDYLNKTWLIKPWERGARYNVGRIRETLGRPRDAAATYRGAATGPARYGSLLRAQLLDPRKEFEPGAEEKDEPKAERPKPETPAPVAEAEEEKKGEQLKPVEEKPALKTPPPVKPKTEKTDKEEELSSSPEGSEASGTATPPSTQVDGPDPLREPKR